MAQVSYIKRDLSMVRPARFSMRFNPGSVLVIVMFAYAVVPAAAQNLVYVRAPVWANVQTETSALASTLGTLLQYAVIGTVAVLAINAVRYLQPSWWFAVFLLPWVTMSIATVYMEGRFSYTSIIYPLVGIVAGSLREPLVALRTVGTLTSSLALFSIGLGLLKPTAGLFPVSAQNDKSIIGDKLLVGPLYHPNTLGETLALGLPFVSLIRSTALRRMSYGLVGFALVWTASRTAIIAAVLGAVVVVAWMFVRKYRQGSMFSPLVLLVIYGSAVFVGPAVVTYGLGDVSSLSGRGQIWQGSLEQWAESPLIGKGVHVYAELAKMWNNVGFGAFHGHNMYVTFLITSGVLGAAALTIVYASILFQSWKLGRAAIIGPAAWTIIFIADGWMEVPSDLFTLGTLSWLAWLPLAVTLAGSLPNAKVTTNAGAAVAEQAPTPNDHPSTHN
jgi:O-antigen ligase